jgi:hypothetical protein
MQQPGLEPMSTVATLTPVPMPGRRFVGTPSPARIGEGALQRIEHPLNSAEGFYSFGECGADAGRSARYPRRPCPVRIWSRSQSDR